MNDQTSEVAASLVEIGVSPEQVHHHVHQNRTLDEVHLLGEALKRIQLSQDKKIAWIELTRDLQQKYQASTEDSQGFADHLIRLKDIEVGILFREEGPGEVKVSFRSKGNIEIYPLANQLGGGGHQFEAGVLMKGDLASIRKKVLESVHALLRRS